MIEFVICVDFKRGTGCWMLHGKKRLLSPTTTLSTKARKQKERSLSNGSSRGGGVQILSEFSNSLAGPLEGRSREPIAGVVMSRSFEVNTEGMQSISVLIPPNRVQMPSWDHHSFL